jgi:acyl dehydratase
MAAAPTRLDYDLLTKLEPQVSEQSFTDKDTMLYALGLGLGYDPMNEDELTFVYEKNLKAFPTFPVVLGAPRKWLRDMPTGIDWVKVVHGEQALVLHRPFPARGTIVGRSRVVDVVDKGEGKGALIYSERTIVDQASGTALASIQQTTFARGNGGFGGPRRATPAGHAIPERAPDVTCDLPTRPEMALIYRLNGDRNPLHSDPGFAEAAGYPRPILHGLATFGIAGHAILKTMCGYDPGRFKSIAGRFSSPVYPGETIRTEMWRDGPVVSFRSRLVERDVIVLNNGRAEIAN